MSLKKGLLACPYCHKHLQISGYYCPDCDITINGAFANSDFSLLSEGQLSFIRTFILVQGNIKEMEKKLAISYPTVKARLQDIIDVLSPQNNEVLDDVFEQLDNGFLSVEEAIDRIKNRR